jgi:hypothetical protein
MSSRIGPNRAGEGGEARQLQAWQTERTAHLLVQIGAIGQGRELLPPQQLRNVRLGHIGGIGQLTLAEAELVETLSDDEGKIHDLTEIDYTHLQI